MCREMKDSGIEWIGEIPREKSIINLKHVLSYIKGKNPNEINDIGKGKPYIGASDLDKDRGYLEYKNYCDEDLPCAEKEDVLVLWDGARAGLIGTNHEGYISSTIVKILPNIKYIKKRFFYWYLRGAEKYLFEQVRGTTIPHMSREFIDNMGMIDFSLNEQEQIVKYLDKKVSEIDDIILKQKSLIEKYKAYKQSLITETVTKGLNKNVHMKYSGIEWIGEIPSHWNIEKGKHILNLLSRQVNEEDEVITCFRDGEVTLRSNRREEGFTFADKEIGYQGIEPGDLVIHGMDGFAGAIGISDSRGKASPVLNVCDTKENKRYIMYYLRRLAYNNVFLALATGIRVRSCDLRWNKIGNLLYPIPPKDEQDIIVDYLDNKIIKIDNLVQIKQDYVDKLEEYKKSLIYECVTGKREVN